MPGSRRLDRFVSECLELSRSAAGKEIRAGAAGVNGMPIRDPAVKVSPGDLVSFRDLELTVFDQLYFMIHKPAGYVCANDDPAHPVIMSLLSDEWGAGQCHCVGRLDIDTTGLLLVTTDGQWSHRITSPRHHTGKIYRVTLEHDPSPDLEPMLRQGILLQGEKRPTAPAEVSWVADRVLDLTIHEGRYHQIKRMIHAAGNEVAALHRLAIGDLSLDPALAPGEHRALTPEEIALF